MGISKIRPLTSQYHSVGGSRGRGLLCLAPQLVKIAATVCHILKLKCTKFDFGWGSAPDSAGGVYSGPPDSDPLAGFKGPTSNGRGGEGREG